MLPLLRQTSPVRLAIFLLFAITCYRLWFITRLELVPDEAYYWLWSKHLALSYRDKGPLIGWTIALGTWLFGPTVFGIRFFAVILGTGTGWLIFLLARRLYDDRTALWCLLLAAVIPIVAVGSILMTIDSLSVFCWAWAALAFWNCLQRDRLGDWFWTGLAIGLGFLAKFTNGVQLGCIALFLLWSKDHRRLLFSRQSLVLGATFAVSILPVIIWNCQTGWVHAMALHSRSGVTNTFGIHPLQLLRFVGEQFGVMSPLIMLGMVIAAAGLLWCQSADLRVRFLLSQYLPVYALFMFFSLNSAGKPNWTAPVLVTGVIFTVVYWRAAAQQRPAWRGWIGAALGLALVMTILMHDTDYLHLPPGRDPLQRAKGWPVFAAHVQQAREQYRANVLIGDHYSQASMMAFYLPDQPTPYLLPEPYGATQFTLWPTYQVMPDTRALFVTTYTNDPPDAQLATQFNQVKLVDDFWTTHLGRKVKEFRIYLCTHT
jgi:4-amino-4-deoxy-L-arabinose transferase-like glycosyltransferase